MQKQLFKTPDKKVSSPAFEKNSNKKALTRQQAFDFFYGKSWKDMSEKEIAEFQINQNFLCTPYKSYFGGLKEIFNGREISKAEMLDFEKLRKEYEN